MLIKALIIFVVTAKLICAFVFAYADCWFSHDAAHLLKRLKSFLLISCYAFSTFRCNFNAKQTHNQCISGNKK